MQVGCGGWVELTFVEKQKAAKKTQKEGKENTENNLFYEQWTNNENIFSIVFKKSGFWEHRKHKKQKHTPYPKHVFSVFCFQEQKTVLENSNQTNPKFFIFMLQTNNSLRINRRMTTMKISLKITEVNNKSLVSL